MTTDSKKPYGDLRQRAEAQLKKIDTDTGSINPTDTKMLIHDLLSYQADLERQNKALHLDKLPQSNTDNRYKMLYEHAPTSFLTLNQQGHIIDANHAACELFAYSHSQRQSIKLSQYIHKEDQKCFSLFFKQLLTRPEKHTIEFRLKHANGFFITVTCQGCCHINAPDEEFFLTLRDISEQKQVEQEIYQLNEQLKQKICLQTAELLKKNARLHDNINEIEDSKRQLLEREAKLNSVFNAAVEGVLTINQKGIIESANIAVTTIFGYQADELIGYNVSKLIPSPHKELHDQYLHNYLISHQANIIGSIRQLEGQRKDNSRVPIDLSISTYKVGHQRYFTGIIRDVSERKRKELLDKLHLDELAHVTRMGLMGEMASGIAHEVNQPLSAIATYCQVTKQLLENEAPDLSKLQEVAQKTEQQARRAGRIIARMREFISTNTQHRSTVDINELVKGAISFAYDDCRQYTIQCKLELADTLPYISADSVQIEQVLLNLIKNSVDSLSKLPKNHPRTLSIQTYLHENKFIEVRVKDNGSGIQKEYLAQIFTPFFTTKTSGMGMGLSICQSLVVSHGGELHFNSCHNKGTTFYFTLPITKDHNGN